MSGLDAIADIAVEYAVGCMYGSLFGDWEQWHSANDSLAAALPCFIASLSGAADELEFYGHPS